MAHDSTFHITVKTHMPMSIKLLSAHPGFKGVSVEHGLGGAVPGSAPTYIAMCHFLFNSIEDFLAAFMQNADVLQGDMPNYTNIGPSFNSMKCLFLSNNALSKCIPSRRPTGCSRI